MVSTKALAMRWSVLAKSPKCVSGSIDAIRLEAIASSNKGIASS